MPSEYYSSFCNDVGVGIERENIRVLFFLYNDVGVGIERDGARFHQSIILFLMVLVLELKEKELFLYNDFGVGIERDGARFHQSIILPFLMIVGVGIERERSKIPSEYCSSYIMMLVLVLKEMEQIPSEYYSSYILMIVGVGIEREGARFHQSIILPI